MTDKEKRLERLLEELQVSAAGFNRYYEGYFACFNRQLFYEAHESLETVWLPARREADGNFFKGLIQLAGAFVHLQKGKAAPGRRLLGMALKNLEGYPQVHHRLALGPVRDLIGTWLTRIDQGELDPGRAPPRLGLG